MEGPAMATKRWLLGRDVLIPLGVLGVIVSVDAIIPALRPDRNVRSSAV